MTSAPELLISRTNGCLELTLNRPDKLNALTVDLIHGLTHAFVEAAQEDDVRSVLLTGSGRGFCAGQDLGKRNPDGADWPPDLRASISENYAPLISAIRELPKPVICAVNGVAAGAGANLALACDIVLAAESAKFIQSFSKVGLVPDSGGTWVLPRLIGQARARALCMTATPVTAETAATWGMIWKSVPSGDLMREARHLAASLAQGPTFALGLTKAALESAEAHDLRDHFKLEADYQGRAGRSADYEEGVRAFLDKRNASFRGK
ncbi:MAG: 2-(1,2-epoxy-1,2-dihydrophenyl)acetyl-CoA isomerase PaaG [Tateyamaria sp.]